MHLRSEQCSFAAFGSDELRRMHFRRAEVPTDEEELRLFKKLLKVRVAAGVACVVAEMPSEARGLLSAKKPRDRGEREKV